LLTLAGPILPNAEVVAILPAAPRDIRVAGLPAALRQPNLRFNVISTRFWSGADNSDGLVACVYPRRFPNPAAKEDTEDDLGVATPAANSYYVK
jgi:hypothetical protein